uniref:Uncharacterized protein n=1 Tax=Siphoviridae sp. ctg0K17 TaxID=2825600 RepID=A0A8S5PWD5_9CAUD|nr:MAG TPA: hypothetical protein [Siphoviridae sp. ctg0K17]
MTKTGLDSHNFSLNLLLKCDIINAEAFIINLNALHIRSPLANSVHIGK